MYYKYVARKNTSKTLSMYDAKHFIWQITLRKILYIATRNMNSNIYSDTRSKMVFIQDIQRGVRDCVIRLYRREGSPLPLPEADL